MQIETHHVPHLDMTFQTKDEAQKFYNSYAFIAGFSVVKAGTYLSRKKEANNAVTRVTFRCNKSGKPKEGDQLAKRKEDKSAEPSKKRNRKSKEGTSTEPAIGKRKSNTVILTGCPAAMVIKLKDTAWQVIRLNFEHNHELSPPGESRFLRSHKNMSDAEKKLIRTLNSVQIPNRKIMAILSFLRGGLSAVPFTKKHVSNLRTSMRKELNQNDMMQVLAFFSQKQSEDPRFFYTFQADENNTVKSIFWSDANCRSCYYQYGDCVSFDTTYRTNKYNLPFAPFVGISGHGDNCLFGCAFLKDETIETFTWLFRTFLTCMGGKAPITVITDQDIAMRTAICKVFPETNHRNCLFHIQKKAQEKAAMCFRRIPGLHDEFMDVLNNSLTEMEFENLWEEMITKYQIQNIKYFQDMWNTRKRFVPVYFKQQFYPFIQTTARSEGTNSVFKDNVASTYSIISFLGEYQRIVDTIEEKQKQQDSVTRGTKPSYWSEYYFERQAARLYNRAIFYRFQQELKGTTKLNTEERELNKTYEVFKSETHAVREFRPRRFIVKIDKQNEQYSCICAKFQKDGILCMHVLKVLIQMNITELPERYFLDRWRPKEKKNIRAHDHNIPKDLGGENSQLRFNILSRKMVDLASQGSKTAEKYAYILKEIDRIEQELESIPSTEATTDRSSHDKSNMYHQISSTDLAEGSTTIKLNDPLNSNPKGRPQKQKGRLKPLAEQLKHIITCSHCGSHDHNVQTCPKMHEDMSSTRKKKNSTRKVTGNSLAIKQVTF